MRKCARVFFLMRGGRGKSTMQFSNFFRYIADLAIRFLEKNIGDLFGTHSITHGKFLPL